MKNVKRALAALLAVFLLLPAVPRTAAVTLSEIDDYDWLEIDRKVDLTRFLPEELRDQVKVEELLGADQFRTCVEKYGRDAAVEGTCKEYYGDLGFNKIDGGLNGSVSLFYEYWLYYSTWTFFDGLDLALKVGPDKNRDGRVDKGTGEIFFMSVKLADIQDMLDIGLLVKPTAGSKIREVERVARSEKIEFKDDDPDKPYLKRIELVTDANEFPKGSASGFNVNVSDKFAKAGVEMSVYSGVYYEKSKIPTDPDLDYTEVFKQGVGMDPDELPSGIWYGSQEFFTIVLRRGNVVQMLPVWKIYGLGGGSKSFFPRLYADDWVNMAGLLTYERKEGDMEIYSITFDAGSNYVADAVYWLRMRYADTLTDDDSAMGEALIKAAYVGNYKDEKDAAAHGAKNIKDELFARASVVEGPGKGGYKANFSGDGVTFTIVDIDGTVHHIKCVVKGETGSTGTETPPSASTADTRMAVYGAYSSPGGKYMSSVFDVGFDNDSYYLNGYQTLFFLDSGKPLSSGTVIAPTFLAADTVSVYAGGNSTVGTKVSGTRQTSGESKVTLNGPVTTVQYSAGAQNGICLKNYWVSYVTQAAGGAKLFVNGATNAISAHRNANGDPYRVVALDSTHGFTHDIFVANIGDRPLTGLKATLTNAKGVRLDEYWNGGNGTLGAFDSAVSGKNPSCATKIRLVPVIDSKGNVYEGEISGTLTISSANGGSVTIQLTGSSGEFAFTTGGMRDAVKYVPYDQAIQNTSTGPAAGVSYRIVEGTLPNGLSLYRNGVIYGVPTAAGTYPFKVEATMGSVSLGLPDQSVQQEFTIKVLDNTDANVWGSTDIGTAGSADDYRITIAIPNDDGSTKNINLGGDRTATTGSNSWSNDTLTMKSEGKFGLFRDLYLDGEKLIPGEDYTAEEGSTVITIISQTIKDKGNGTHTLAAEFYESHGNDGTLSTAAQNITVTKSTSSGGSSGGTTTVSPFKDVPAGAWYYNDVMWARQKGYMAGTSATEFSPNTYISQATVVTVLARMSGVDVSQFEGQRYENITPGKYYSNAAVWASQAGLLPDSTYFQENGSFTRGEMAVILMKYLRGMGVDTSMPATPAKFADEAKMDPETYTAFQVLFSKGIFKGTGGNAMEPDTNTARSHFCALLQRTEALTKP